MPETNTVCLIHTSAATAYINYLIKNQIKFNIDYYIQYNETEYNCVKMIIIKMQLSDYIDSQKFYADYANS